MDRRNFLKASSLISLPLLLKSCQWPLPPVSGYTITVRSDANTGHLLFGSKDYPVRKGPTVNTLVVGGGIAGLSAACSLPHQDFLVCELSDRLGGSSSASQYGNTTFAQGAHYDLEYPKAYGEETLQLLERLNIVEYLPWKQAWGFKDQQHVIVPRRENRCYDHGTFRNDVLESGQAKDDFLKAIFPYQGNMHMPTRLIDKSLHHLNALSFTDFLREKMPMTEDFMRAMDYHMKDDYGAGASTVSALAGIHYFMCRPYYTEVPELFSPPEGNHYFIKKLADQLNSDQILLKHLIKSIQPTRNGFTVHLIDIDNKEIKAISAAKLVYAGQKHALRYIYPEDHEIFKTNEYAPWMVVNVIMENTLGQLGYWQNEMLIEDESFLGFVDSNTQNPDSEYRVFTAYYCLPVASRKDLITIETNKEQIASMTISRISTFLGADIADRVKEVQLKAMGHAMPIPKVGYLFDDKNQYRSHKNLVYAGVDNARLPLLFEALDSGIQAAKLLNED